MKYTVHAPPEALQEYVDHLWTVEAGGDGSPDLTLKFFATCAPCIVFQHHNGRSAITHQIVGGVRQACQEGHPTSFIRGPITQPFQCVTEGAPTAIGIELKPQAFSTLTGIDASELSDRLVALGAFSTANLDEQLLNATTQPDQIALLTRFLTVKALAGPTHDALVMQSLRLIHENARSMHVRDLLKSLNVSERQFERRFARNVGVPPSFYLRVMRFQKTVRLIKAGRFERLSDLAYDLGYTDQSHFIKDVKEFTGSTPTNLSHAIEECSTMPQYGTLVRQRILIRQTSSPNGVANRRRECEWTSI